MCQTKAEDLRYIEPKDAIHDLLTDAPYAQQTREAILQFIENRLAGKPVSVVVPEPLFAC